MRATPGDRPASAHATRSSRWDPPCTSEIIGPDPDQPAPQQPRTFGIDALTAPRLVTWAAKSGSLEDLVRDAQTHGIMFGAVGSGSRKTPQGTLLQWRYTSPRTVIADGLVPFFIDWGKTPHPAASAAQGATIIALRAEHPDAERVQQILTQLGLDLSRHERSRPRPHRGCPESAWARRIAVNEHVHRINGGLGGSRGGWTHHAPDARCPRSPVRPGVSTGGAGRRGGRSVR